jgi:hypothetical protein
VDTSRTHRRGDYRCRLVTGRLPPRGGCRPRPCKGQSAMLGLVAGHCAPASGDSPIPVHTLNDIDIVDWHSSGSSCGPAQTSGGERPRDPTAAARSLKLNMGTMGRRIRPGPFFLAARPRITSRILREPAIPGTYWSARPPGAGIQKDLSDGHPPRAYGMLGVQWASNATARRSWRSDQPMARSPRIAFRGCDRGLRHRDPIAAGNRH